MPLMGNGNHLCLGCENERQIANSRYILDDNDDTVFTSPPCPKCGAQETFFAHDVVYLVTRTELVVIEPEQDGDAPVGVQVMWEEPDPEEFRARHMVTIHETAQALGRKVKKLKGEFGQPSTLDYPTPPPKLKPAEVKEHVAKIKPKPPTIRTKADADKQAAAVKQDVEAQRKAHRAKRKALGEGA